VVALLLTRPQIAHLLRPTAAAVFCPLIGPSRFGKLLHPHFAQFRLFSGFSLAYRNLASDLSLSRLSLTFLKSSSSPPFVRSLLPSLNFKFKSRPTAIVSRLSSLLPSGPHAHSLLRYQLHSFSYTIHSFLLRENLRSTPDQYLSCSAPCVSQIRLLFEILLQQYSRAQFHLRIKSMKGSLLTMRE